ncbi:MAG: pyridoxal kinase [Rhodospirillaceae bacterium]|nr:pyridoxal kinase [Rhodospirillaceae bacterium]|tara:strand:- start:3494 stop:4327 length:834 start_codon:yes stop_codon:yes gene_type:complete
MAVLSISSYVSRGYVGNRAISFALESLGEEVIALPTVIFSNHPGNSSYSGFSIQASDLAAFFEEFKTTNNINNLKLALSGYLGSETQVEVIKNIIIDIKKNTKKLYICDPVIGNEKGMFVEKDLAENIKTNLVPLADVVTPNQFELEFLSGKKINTLSDLISASSIISDMGAKAIVVTSSYIENQIVSIFCSNKNGSWILKLPLLSSNSNGAGDLFSALLAYNFCIKNLSLIDSVKKASMVCWSVIKYSDNIEYLDVVKFLNKGLDEKIQMYVEQIF